MVRNREANVLAKTFRDQMSVYRTRRVRDPETQGTVEKEILVYEDIPCALSQKGNDTPERQEFHSEKKRLKSVQDHRPMYNGFRQKARERLQNVC